jgi:dolichyl-diphosphooligosaccharide--protein glycosyltransferase/undecaprenyl-diphosphooligosaccharide--protein glycosyltransferase
VAAMSAVYLFFVMGEFLKDSRAKYAFVIVATAAMIYPNITHIIGYKVPTVLNKTEVQDLVKLDEMAGGKDYTIAWWDYGYPIWFYSDTNTLIDGGKHNNDNFIISTIMQTSSPELAANLSRLAVETYVDSNYSVVSNVLFKSGEKNQTDPGDLIEALKDPDYKLPPKTRDIYFYMPLRMLGIFPTVAVFGNLDLETGKKLRNITFYPTRAVSNKNGMVHLANGIVLDLQKGKVQLGNQLVSLQYFLVTENRKDGSIKVQGQRFDPKAALAVVFMKSYGKFIVMDTETLNSIYVKMFILGQYDKNLFELVVASPYSRIYKLKK